MEVRPGFKEKPRRSLWLFGLESDQPTLEQRQERASDVSKRLGRVIEAPQIPTADELVLPVPKISPPDALSEFCFQDNYERALHANCGGRQSFVYTGVPNPPDIVAHPRTNSELEAILEWCDGQNYIAIPYGGGSSVVMELHHQSTVIVL